VSGAAGRKLVDENVEQGFDRTPPEEWVSQRRCLVYLVNVAATCFLDRDISLGFELADDGLRSTLGDAHEGRDLAHAAARLAREHQKDEPVGGEEDPRVRRTTRVSGNIVREIHFPYLGVARPG